MTSGDILWNGESLLELAPDERAAHGVFLAFQYPLEIPGVATMYVPALLTQRACGSGAARAELTTPRVYQAHSRQSR